MFGITANNVFDVKIIEQKFLKLKAVFFAKPSV